MNTMKRLFVAISFFIVGVHATALTSTLAVVRSYYGDLASYRGADNTLDVTSALGNLINGKTIYTFPASKNTIPGFSDKAPMIVKSLIALYSFGSVKYALFTGENDTPTIPNQNNRQCPAGSVTVIKAFYGDPVSRRTVDVTAKLNQLISHANYTVSATRITFNAGVSKNYLVATDPAPGIVKKLIIFYCDGNNLLIQVIGENDAATINAAAQATTATPTSAPTASVSTRTADLEAPSAPTSTSGTGSYSQVPIMKDPRLGGSNVRVVQ